jgi:uncharacterized protein YjaZ
MEKITFKIKDIDWSLDFVDADDVKLDKSLGLTFTIKRLILVDKNLNKTDLITTITHELTHAFMWEYGFSQVDFSHENICDFISVYARNIIELSDTIVNHLNMFK